MAIDESGAPGAAPTITSGDASAGSVDRRARRRRRCRRPLRRRAPGRRRALRARRPCARPVRAPPTRRCGPPSAPTTSTIRRADAAAAVPMPARSAREQGGGPGAVPRGRTRPRRRPTTLEAAARDWLDEINEINNAARDAPRPPRPASARRPRDRGDARAPRPRGGRRPDRRRRPPRRRASWPARRWPTATSARRTEAQAQPAAVRPHGRTARASPSRTTRRSWRRSSRRHADDLPAPARRSRRDDPARARARRRRSRAEQRRWQLQLGRPGRRDRRGRHRGVSARVPGRPRVLGRLHRDAGPRHRPTRCPRSATGSTGSAAGSTSGIPSQRDLSLALGYAGLDPMRIRHWPTRSETAALVHARSRSPPTSTWRASPAT